MIQRRATIENCIQLGLGWFRHIAQIAITTAVIATQNSTRLDEFGASFDAKRSTKAGMATFPDIDAIFKIAVRRWGRLDRFVAHVSKVGITGPIKKSDKRITPNGSIGEES